MRTCSTCGEVYGDDVARCRTDGTALRTWLATEPHAPGAPRSAASLSPVGPTERAVGTPPAIRVLVQPDQTVRTLAGRYTIGRALGVGGFGAVYEAHDARLQKRVAVKVLSPHVSDDPEALARFQQEAVAASAVRHDGIVDVTDFDRDADGTQFLVMELLEGQDLSSLVDRRGALPFGEALAICARVADALAAAHAAGILHRDLKPANVYLTRVAGREDFVKVLDFGISKVLSASNAAGLATATGRIIGTPHYMSPEQAIGGRALDARADVYSLGVILYELLTARWPFDGETHVQIIAQHLNRVPRVPSAVTPNPIPPEVDALVMAALEKEPEDRLDSMAAFRDRALDLLAQHEPDTLLSKWPERRASTPASAVPSGAPDGRARRPLSPAVPSPAPVAASPGSAPSRRPPSTLGSTTGEASLNLTARRPIGRWLAAGLLGAVLVGLGVWLFAGPPTGGTTHGGAGSSPLAFPTRASSTADSATTAAVGALPPGAAPPSSAPVATGSVELPTTAGGPASLPATSVGTATAEASPAPATARATKKTRTPLSAKPATGTIIKDW